MRGGVDARRGAHAAPARPHRRGALRVDADPCARETRRGPRVRFAGRLQPRGLRSRALSPRQQSVSRVCVSRSDARAGRRRAARPRPAPPHRRADARARRRRRLCRCAGAQPWRRGRGVGAWAGGGTAQRDGQLSLACLGRRRESLDVRDRAQPLREGASRIVRRHDTDSCRRTSVRARGAHAEEQAPKAA